MTTELLPEVKEPATELPPVEEPVAPPPTQAEPVTEPEPAAPTGLEELTTKFLQDRGYELPTQDGEVQESTPAQETLTPEQVEARAQEIAEQRIAEQNRLASEQGTVVDYRNRAERIRGTLAQVASGAINLQDVIPNTTVTWAQAISNEFDNHHAQSGRVAVNGFVQGLWADMAQDLPEAQRKEWITARAKDKTVVDTLKDYTAAVIKSKGLITEAEAKRRAAKDLLEFKKQVEPFLPGYVPPKQTNGSAAGSPKYTTKEQARNLHAQGKITDAEMRRVNADSSVPLGYGQRE